MEQRSSSLDEIIMHRAMSESHLYYGGQGPAKNPLEMMIDAELDEHDKQRNGANAEVLLALLRFASDGINIPGIEISWKRISRAIKPGHTVSYIKPTKADAIPWAYVEILDAAGNMVERFEPARLKYIRQPRSAKEQSPAAVILCLSVESQSAAIRVGTRVLSLAALAGVNEIRELSGQGVAEKLGVTRQAVSLTNKAMDAKIREATGGKAGARGLRHKADPRKGKTLNELTTTHIAL